MIKFALSTLTIAVASTLFAAPSIAKDFVFNPGSDGVLLENGAHVVYYKWDESWRLSNGDNITKILFRVVFSGIRRQELINLLSRIWH